MAMLQLIVALVATSCKNSADLHGERRTGVVIKENEKGKTIALNAPNIATSDVKRINSILKRYDKKLFKWEEYQGGQLQRSMGEMRKADVSEVFEAAKLKRPVMEGFGHYAASVTCCGGGTPHTTPGGGPRQPPEILEREFKELEAILEPYQHGLAP